MALGMGQMPMQPGGPGQMSSFAKPATSLGFPRLPAQPGAPTAQPMWAPGTVPSSATAPAPKPAPAPAPSPTGVMPINAAAGLPTQNVPASVIGDPVSQPIAQPAQGQGFDRPDKGVGFEQRWQDRLTQMAQNHPGFLDRMQSMMGRNAGIFGRLQRRDPGFDWSAFINGLGTPAAPVGAAATPAVPAATPAAPAPAVGNAAIFNPLNLPGIGG